MGVVYEQLRNLGELCRIDGVSSVRDHSSLGRQVTLRIAKLHPSDAKSPYSPAEEFTSHPLTALSASLINLEPGSVWTDGRKTFSPPDILESKGRLLPLTIDTSLYQEVNLTELSKLLIPKYKFGIENLEHLKDMRFIKVPILGDSENKYLVVPCLELIRFYIGVSSRFMSSALEGAWYKYFDSENSFIQNGEVTLKLKKRIRRSESIVLARYIADAKAMEAFTTPHKSLQKAHQDGKDLNIYGLFPFSDKTTLKVSGLSGVLLPSGKSKHSNDKCIIALKLNSCSYPKSFSKINYEFEDGAYSPNYTDEATENSQEGGFFIPESQKDKEDKEITYTPGDKRLNRVGITTSANPFPGFREISYQIYTKPGKKHLFGRPIASYPEKDILTDADGDFTKESEGQRGADHHVVTPSHKSRDLSLFIDMLNVFRESYKDTFIVTTLGINSEIVDFGERISQFPEMEGRYSWHILKKIKEFRQLVCAEFKHKESSNKFYLLELELDPERSKESHGTALLFTDEFDDIPEDTFIDYLKLTVYCRRRWAIPGLDWECKGLKKHAELADAIFTDFNIFAARLRHSPSKKDQETDDIRIDPKDWCKAIVKCIRENHPRINGLFQSDD